MTGRRKDAFDMEQASGPEPVVVTFPAVPGSAPRPAGGELAALAAPAAPAAITALAGARLRVLRVVCGAMLAGVALLAAASVIVVRSGMVRPVASTGLSLTLTLLAAVLIVAASRLQAAILARVGRGGGGRPETGGAPALAAAPVLAAARSAAADVLGAYVWATIAGFASLAAAAVLGLAVAVVTGVARYALVICGVAALGMVARWPRRAAVLGLLRRRGLA